ncbi:fimbrillin family protein [uncultured Alistipes sp.]|jgi:putative lipoprotein|uniref:fimbrillin family protein n=1 Tax=uncultured Alistipes sp. TaxID=538949 RepID=UPI0025EB3406|nr:fimbrillin family protein [uncultured Alistipes sp.]
MKTAKFFTLAAVAALTVAATSCSKDNEKTSGGDDLVPVSFTSGIATRASGAAWTAEDQIGVYMLDEQFDVVTPYANKAYKTAVAGTTGTFTAVDGVDMYYPQDGSEVMFMAYYPYHSTLDATESFVLDLSAQDTPAKVEKIDLMRVTELDTYSKTDPEVELVFEHQLSKFIINAIADPSLGKSSLAGMTVTIRNVYIDITYKPETGDLATTSGAVLASIAPLTITDGVVYEALVLPVYTQPEVDFTIDGETFTWKPAGSIFEAGKEHTWDVTLKYTGVEGIQASIKPWDPTGTGGTGIAE